MSSIKLQELFSEQYLDLPAFTKTYCQKAVEAARGEERYYKLLKSRAEKTLEVLIEQNPLTSGTMEINSGWKEVKAKLSAGSDVSEPLVACLKQDDLQSLIHQLEFAHQQFLGKSGKLNRFLYGLLDKFGLLAPFYAASFGVKASRGIKDDELRDFFNGLYLAQIEILVAQEEAPKTKASASEPVAATPDKGEDFYRKLVKAQSGISISVSGISDRRYGKEIILGGNISGIGDVRFNGSVLIGNLNISGVGDRSGMVYAPQGVNIRVSGVGDTTVRKKVVTWKKLAEYLELV